FVRLSRGVRKIEDFEDFINPNSHSVVLVINKNIYDTKENLPMYSPEKGEGRDIIRGIELMNRLLGLEYFLNIGYADSFFEY
ncbi:MAG: hypothetical protein ACOCTN_03230, partial [Candidatus Natronoplasma sp.]